MTNEKYKLMKPDLQYKLTIPAGTQVFPNPANTENLIALSIVLIIMHALGKKQEKKKTSI